jgi:threonine aldolase
MHRRGFLSTTALASLQLNAADPAGIRVFAYGDGIPWTPEEYARLLTTLTADARTEPDEYSRGGVVEKLEARMAALLGKEAAVWLPTGTLANQLAIRLLCAGKKRALVQAESHLYRDCGDCVQNLSGITLVPLAPGRAKVTMDDVDAAASESMLGRVATPIGAVQIETPVRRRLGQRVDLDQIRRISGWARERSIGLHLDGARLFLEAAYTKTDLLTYTNLFDTVYVSLYKYFNAASGAVLAGPKALLAELYHTRRMYGGGLPQVWPFAAVALHTLDGFEARFRKAVEVSEQVISRLAGNPSFQIERIPEGTNVFRLRVVNVNAPVYQLRLETAGISARIPLNDWFALQVNETWTRLPAEEIYNRFVTALG